MCQGCRDLGRWTVVTAGWGSGRGRGRGVEQVGEERPHVVSGDGGKEGGVGREVAAVCGF
jgi:hypothetical protein